MVAIDDNEIRAQDILLGRCPVAYHHPGNMAFRFLVRLRLQLYSASTKQSERSKLFSDIGESIMRADGRFLTKGNNPPKGKCDWSEVSNSKIRVKIAQSFRDGHKAQGELAMSEEEVTELLEGMGDTTAFGTIVESIQDFLDHQLGKKKKRKRLTGATKKPNGSKGGVSSKPTKHSTPKSTATKANCAPTAKANSNGSIKAKPRAFLVGSAAENDDQQHTKTAPQEETAAPPMQISQLQRALAKKYPIQAARGGYLQLPEMTQLQTPPAMHPENAASSALSVGRNPMLPSYLFPPIMNSYTSLVSQQQEQQALEPGLYPQAMVANPFAALIPGMLPGGGLFATAASPASALLPIAHLQSGQQAPTASLEQTLANLANEQRLRRVALMGGVQAHPASFFPERKVEENLKVSAASPGRHELGSGGEHDDDESTEN